MHACSSNKIDSDRFERLTVVSIKIKIFQDVTPCQLRVTNIFEDHSVFIFRIALS